MVKNLIKGQENGLWTLPDYGNALLEIKAFLLIQNTESKILLNFSRVHDTM